MFVCTAGLGVRVFVDASKGLMRKPHQACFSAGRAEARSSDPLITFEKGECVFCHLKGQLFIEFIHPAIVFHMEWFLQKDLTSAQVYPVPRLFTKVSSALTFTPRTARTSVKAGLACWVQFGEVTL